MTQRENKAPYEVDFYAWTIDQAAVLRTMPTQNGLDVMDLAIEIECLDRQQYRAVKDAVREIFIRLIELKYAPKDKAYLVKRPDIRPLRDKLADLFGDSPSLKDEVWVV